MASGLTDTGVTCLGVNRIIVASTGSAGHNVGKVQAINSAQSVIFCSVSPTNNASSSCVYTIPSSRTLIIREANIYGKFSDSNLLVYSLNRTSGLRFLIGKFFIDSGLTQIKYDLDALIDQGNVILVDIEPLTPVSTLTNQVINININGVLNPLINNF